MMRWERSHYLLAVLNKAFEIIIYLLKLAQIWSLTQTAAWLSGDASSSLCLDAVNVLKNFFQTISISNIPMAFELKEQLHGVSAA